MKRRDAVDFLPTTWGQSQLFAFSGLDGQTDWFNPFVGQTLGDGAGILFHTDDLTEGGFEVRFGARPRMGTGEVQVESICPRVVGPDILDLDVDLSQGGRVRFRLVWLDSMTVLGETQAREAVPCLCTTGSFYQLPTRVDEGPAIIGSGHILKRRKGVSAMELEGSGGLSRFLVMDGPGLKGRAEAALRSDLGSVFADRMRFYAGLPLPQTDEGEVLRTFVKACAIMKANIEAPCGEITARWSTPDRWPHRRMWLWDSAFNSLGAQHIDPALGKDLVRAVLTKQKPDGFIPHTMAPDPDRDSRMTQPPLLAWAAWELHRSNPDKEFLHEVYGALKAYLEWDISNLDRLGTGLLQWQHAGPDSGMDNSPRFDDGPDFDAVDLNCFAANESQVLGMMASELGLAKDAERWSLKRTRLASAINDRLWHEGDGFYHDRREDGSWVRIKTVDGFLPLFAGIAGKERAAVLIRHLTDRKEFWPVLPVPSVALDEPKFELDMWRGPTWINYDWLVVIGLRRFGYVELANELIDLVIRGVSRWRARRGSIYEFYDPFGKKPPQDLKRKGKVHRPTGDGIPVVAEYFWSAAMFAHMALDRYGLDPDAGRPEQDGAWNCPPG